MENKDFDPSRILRVPIDRVEPNDYNPKKKDTPEYKKVVESLRVNGLKQPIFVREVDGNDNYVIVDGEQRWTAAKELGYKDIYIYNYGNIPEEEAKALTIWMEVQVPFDELELATLIVEMKDLDIDLPYSDKEIEDFVAMADFDFTPPVKEDEPDDGLMELKIRMTNSQLEFVNKCINAVVDKEGCEPSEALYVLCGGVNE